MNFQPINPDQHLKELKRIAKYHSVHLSMNISAILAIIGGAGVLIIASFFLPQGKSLFPTITACDRDSWWIAHPIQKFPTIITSEYYFRVYSDS